ncbi:polyprenyl synthetase family protein [Legionella longbeachae]|uniref:polyprenyl synthetase family protein n=1 Tax=Legionella longbeachae TaxID=450 RepID=UPI000A1C14CF|nr:farnesyl diphosphate synthase [Legionella longbeachae]ARM34604.1 polyprenyl synthetase family protein [Legionella longbeachae]HBD7396139.1 polyprenyl synthetase family protein [Legionella pneumophila]
MISKYINRHESYLKQVIADSSVPAVIIRSAIDYSLFPGGKRIRPILVYLTGSLLDVDLNILDAIAAAVELTHCYSLIHDDLPAMDNDDLRRGRPSCHKAFDEATAILAGDGMQALAIDVLLTYLPHLVQPDRVISITRELVQATGISGMVSGQSLDLSELAKSSIDDERLKEIHHLKTGRLILACIEMVLRIQSTPEAYQSALRTYANHIGLVFQMQDDYLDYHAPAEFLGKGRSSDLANKKTTFATLYTKDKLEMEISRHYEIALDALQIFGQKALLLIKLTKELQERSNRF